MRRRRIVGRRKCKVCGAYFITDTDSQCCSPECATEYKNQVSWKTTLCWECKKATTGECTWSASLTPVEGWTATPTVVMVGGSCEKAAPSYIVHKCPLFEKDNREELK